MGIQYDVGEYLLRADVRATGPTPTPPRGAGVDKALVFIETRDTFWGPSVVASAVRTHPDWTLYVFGTPAVIERIRARFPNAVSVIIDPIRDISEYNRLLYSREFWDVFPESWVLLFQTDTVLVRGCRAEHFAFDYLGAVCGEVSPDAFIMNGGLSLRRVAAMRRACDLLTHHDRALPEDVGFCRVMRRHAATHGFALPDIDACHDFAIESFGNPIRAIGMHGTDKYYASVDIVRALLTP